MRIKRGLTKTEEKKGMYKDQAYLIGAIKILKNRKKINFKLLHSGNIF